jgi:hypothetical protein
MLTPAEEHRHRNAIDDARHAYRGYKIRRNLLVISIIVFALWSLTAPSRAVRSPPAPTTSHTAIWVGCSPG